MLKSLITLVWMLSLLGVRPAWAQASDEEAGVKAFIQGIRLARTSKYDEALEAFERAWTLSQDPQALFRIAKVEEARGDCARAIRAFERFLKHCEDCPNGAEGQTAAQEVKKRCEIHIIVETTPSGARLSANGKEVGRTPFKLSPKPGNIILKATLDGFTSREERLKLNGGEVRTLSWALAPVVSVMVESASRSTDTNISELIKAPEPVDYIWTYTAWGVGVVAMVMSGVFYWMYDEKKQEFHNLDEGASGRDILDQQEIYGNISIYSAIFGGVGLLSGTALYFTIDSDLNAQGNLNLMIFSGSF